MAPARRKAVYAGSFDPPTNGHLWMFEQASQMFDEVIIAIGINPEKKTLFPIDVRETMLLEIAAHLPNVTVATFVNQYLIHYTASVGADFIIRGIRNSQDYEYEKAMRNINGDIDPAVTMLFLMPPRNIAEVSSSVVKGLVGPRGWAAMVSGYVPTPVFRRLLESRHTIWKTLAIIGATGDDRQFWELLWTAYFHADRKYHNWQHVCAMIDDFVEVREQCENPAAVETAIWFHDLVYDSRRNDNEQCSADIAVSTLQSLGVDQTFCDQVGALIMATKHDCAPTDNDARILVDLDLAILGKPAEVFDQYEKGVRAEYGWVAASQFAEGRSSVLRGFLDRKPIYSTGEFAQRYESQARQNLERSIAKLAPGNKPSSRLE